MILRLVVKRDFHMSAASYHADQGGDTDGM